MEFRNSQAGPNTRRYPEPTRPNTPNDNNAMQGGGVSAPTQMSMQSQKKSSRGFSKPVMVIIAAVIVIALAVGGWFAWSSMNSADGIKRDQYQAVFLTNGQVYFCKLSDVQSTYVKCADIFYLQVQQNVQPADSKDKTTDQSQVSLAKLGSELHGPEDSMYISRQQVLFWENLKNDGKVVQAINSYKQQNK